MQSEFFLDNLPIQIHQIIFSFLSRSDIFLNLSSTCKNAKQIVEHPLILIDILKQRIPTFDKKIFLQKQSQQPFKKEYNPKALKLLVQTSLDHTYELPFWGFRTNGGVGHNHLRYWIGKSFTKSQNQAVATALTEKVYVESSLSFDIVKFKTSILSMANYLKQYQEFSTNIHNFKFQDLNVSHIFHQAFQLEHHLNKDELEDDDEVFVEAIDNFRGYINDMYDYFQSVSPQGDNLLNKQPQTIPNVISHIQSIEINREGYFQTPLKTFMLLGSKKSFEHWNESYLEASYQCKSIDKVLKLMNNHGYNQYQVYDKGVQYVTFNQEADVDLKDNKEYFPILWFSFGKAEDKIFSHKINLPVECQCYVRNLLLVMIDKDACIAQPQVDYYTQSTMKLQGLSLSYISLKGHIITNEGDKFQNYDI